MYAMPVMLVLADQDWNSVQHRAVAEVLLIGNPRITTRDELRHWGKAINDLTEREVSTITMDKARKLGIPH